MKNVMLTLLIILIIILTIFFIRHIGNYKEGINLNKVKTAIKDVGKFGNDIKNIGSELGNQIKKVDNLGNDLTKFGKEIEKTSQIPVKMANDLDREIQKISKKAEKQITNSFNETKNFFDDLVDEVWTETRKITKEIEQVPFKVEKISNDIFLGYIPDFIRECWYQFDKYVITPIRKFFTNIGYLFLSTGNVFKEIILKIISIPSCVPIYVIESSRAGFKYIYDKYFPSWFKQVIDFINTYIIQLIIVPIFGIFIFITKFILQIFGFKFPSYDYESNKNKCFNFGPLNKVFELLITAIKEIFNILETIFDALNIDKIINEIMSVFTGKRKKRKSSPTTSRVQNTVDNFIDTTNNTMNNISSTAESSINNTLDGTKDMLSSIGIDVPSTDISESLNNVRSNIASLSGFF